MFRFFTILPWSTFSRLNRYFPINNAYEILKSKGLQLSNNELTTKILDITVMKTKDE